MYLPTHTHTTTKIGLFRWLWRRLLRYWLLLKPSSLASVKCLLLTTGVTFAFLQLYLCLHNDGPSTTAAHFGNTSYLSDLSNLLRLRSFDQTALQISGQLSQIERSLKENRRILQEIRANIHSASLNLTQSDRDILANTGGNPHYALSRQPHCPAPRKWADVDMERVYEEIPFDNPDGGVWKQGWQLQPEPKDLQMKLRIFVVPHSHNDPGWVKTFDTYFQQQTKAILTNAVDWLNKHPDMRMIWAEVSYLSAWWETVSSDQLRNGLRDLVRSGRMEVVTGGWVMNDEANTHYFAMLAQMVEGHEWLRDKLGVVPANGWAIDPFGVSPTMAYLLRGMGLSGMVVQRVHYSVKKFLAQRKQLEFRWRQQWEQSAVVEEDIVCHVEPFYSYDVPHTCGPDPKVCCQFDFKRLPAGKVKCPWKVPPVPITERNVEERAKLLLDQYRKKSLLYATDSLLVPLGDDFRFDKPQEWHDQYFNYRKLMDYINSHPELNAEIRFATLRDYFDSIGKEMKQQLPSLSGDFFTYSDREDHYWSGYYTSKPFYKRFERVLASHLRSTESLFSLANILQTDSSTSDPFATHMDDFKFARQNLALFQHHDGITGTAKDFVVKDYAKRMYRSFSILEQITSVSIHSIAQSYSKTQVPLIDLQFMNRFPNQNTALRRTLLHLDSNSQKYFILYNSLGWSLQSELFCFEIKWNTDSEMPDWCVRNTATGRLVRDIQVNHVWAFPIFDQLLPNHREICFQPSLSALSLEQYCVGQCHCEQDRPAHHRMESFVTLYNHPESYRQSNTIDSHILSLLDSPTNLTIENELVKLHFDSSTDGQLTGVQFYIPENDTWLYLSGTAQVMTYGTRPGGKNVAKSGAYIFLPDESTPKLLKQLKKPKIRLLSGHIESRYEIHFESPFPVYLKWSLIRGRKSIELTTEFQLQGLYGSNRELLIRFDFPAIRNGDRFYTDLNGFQLIGRKRFEKIPLQGNVYPLNTMASIEGPSGSKDLLRLSVLTGQPLGVTSAHSGSLDIFLDRRLTQDDQRGLNQGVLDNKHTREVFHILFENPLQAKNPASPTFSSAELFESQTLLNPVKGMTASEVSPHQPILPFNQSISFLRHSLPCDIHWLNFRRDTSQHNQFGLWLHRFGLSCDSNCVTLNRPVRLADLFNERLTSQLDTTRLEQTGLTLLNSTKLIHYNESIRIEPMQIVAYKLFT